MLFLQKYKFYLILSKDKDFRMRYNKENLI